MTLPGPYRINGRYLEAANGGAILTAVDGHDYGDGMSDPAFLEVENEAAFAVMCNVATLEAALRTIQSAIPGYLKGEMSEHDFAILVIGEADSSMVNKALEKGR